VDVDLFAAPPRLVALAESLMPAISEFSAMMVVSIP
jgi:hypothetical protein